MRRLGEKKLQARSKRIRLASRHLCSASRSLPFILVSRVTASSFSCPTCWQASQAGIWLSVHSLQGARLIQKLGCCVCKLAD